MTLEWCKIWRKTHLWFGKWTEEFGRFSGEYLKVSKWELWWHSFDQSRKCELKIYREVMCHDNEEWCKNRRGIDLPVQNWHETFDEFQPEHSKISQIFTLMDCFWPKYIILEL